jgi:hypothetical protein
MSLIEESPKPAPDWRVAYCAGYFDGEGSIWVGTQNRKSYYLRISIASADYETLLLFEELIGGEVTPVKASSSRKEIFRWSKNSNDAVKMLLQFLPFLTAKREQAQLVIDYGWEIIERGTSLSVERNDKRNALRQALQEAKQKGLKSRTNIPGASAFA